MKTNTELLMNVLGWKGGTVHQVAQSTGLEVLTILGLQENKAEDVYQLEMFNKGYQWVIDGSSEHNIPKGYKGYPVFWLGAMTAQESKN